MQYFSLIISILVTLAAKYEAAEDALEPLISIDESPVSTSNGPVTSAMENLAYNTASIADEISSQVNSKLERTAGILHGGIEILIATALEQLAQPIYQATRKLSNESCNATLSLAELRSDIDLRLGVCTEELYVLMQTYKLDADRSSSAIENFVNEIIDLPKACGRMDDLPSEEGFQTFAGNTRCFVEGIAALNEQISNELSTVNLLLSRTRKLSRQSESQALLCIDKLVSEFVKLIEEKLKDC
ncbi:uncharacterized protein LOC129238776 [Anastrepha obliqua]|uniref:uncharacterized protein LOC129238776 n=1 Tax=Anastrepha obliqua TaxID=95512 RepID=UPI00240924B3|nr:uncharacterized protein LOC129238776 [Anastrepha obliqua]